MVNGLGILAWRLPLIAVLASPLLLIVPDMMSKPGSQPLGIEQPHCSLRARSAAKLRLAAVETAFERQDIANLDRLVADAREAVKASLVCEPLDMQMWLFAARAHALSGGDAQSINAYLELACATRPHSLWAADARARAFERFPQALLSDALLECNVADRERLRRFAFEQRSFTDFEP